MTRKHWIASVSILLGLAALVGGWVLWWHVAAGQLAKSIDLWIAAREADGYKIDAARDPIVGFPFRLRTRIAAPAAAAGDGSWSWAGPDLAIDAPAWSPLSIAFAMPGAHRVSTEGHRYDVQANEAGGVLLLARDGRLERLTLTAKRISAQEEGKPTATIDSLHAELGEPAHDEAAPVPVSLSFELAVETVALPPDAAVALGPQIDRIELTGRVEGPPPRGFDAAALSAWRDAGGAIDLDSVTLAWGPLKLTGNGSLSLDESLRPLAAASTEIQGAPEALQALAEAGLMKTNDAQLAALGMALLADGEGRVKLPLTAEDGELSSGPIKLATLPPIVRP
jgi:hypothetical protein